MKKFALHTGLFLIIIGTITLILTRFSRFASFNGLLITGLLLIVAGIILLIRSIKQESKY